MSNSQMCPIFVHRFYIATLVLVDNNLPDHLRHR